MKNILSKTSFMALALVIGASALASGANAQDNWQRGPEKVVVVQHPVVVAQLVRRGGLFDRLDMNRDGVVSKWEFQQRYGSGRMAMRTFYRTDVQHNSKLTRQEVAANRAMIKELPMRG